MTYLQRKETARAESTPDGEPVAVDSKGQSLGWTRLQSRYLPCDTRKRDTKRPHCQTAQQDRQ
jgi:alkylated DNA repair dioxygenase AlkB